MLSKAFTEKFLLEMFQQFYGKILKYFSKTKKSSGHLSQNSEKYLKCMPQILFSSERAKSYRA